MEDAGEYGCGFMGEPVDTIIYNRLTVFDGRSKTKWNVGNV